MSALPLRYLVALSTGIALSIIPLAAHAFCGFYVSGADAKLYNNATLVVMMRHGTRTVLSMQNNYQGPPQDFAMVVPVPVVLQEENVKTLDKGVFDRVDQLAAPRLVEYWEQDPCNPYPQYEEESVMMADMAPEAAAADDEEEDLGVKIEAQFTVGEYQIVILSAQDSSGLDTWLRREKYRIPEGAEPLLRPYVASGMKFFVAKVDVKKVAFQNGQAMLSPLRFHYDSEQFNLPVRLGLMNSSGKQDLLVHILAPGQRYEVANYDNVTIPTNLSVKDEVRKQFGAFYASLFDATLEKNPNAVVTEYSWDASSCDPCPTPALSWDELATLGADVIPGGLQMGMVLTRLHARYGKESLGQDLVFRAAPPIVGGREVMSGEGGGIERGARPDSINNFQGRYIIRHAWTGPILCQNPQRGIWGGPNGGNMQVQPAKDIAFAPRGEQNLASFLATEVSDADMRKSPGDPSAGFKTSGIPSKPRAGGCAGCASTGTGMGGMAGSVVLLALFLAFQRRAWLARLRAGRRASERAASGPL